MEFSFKKVTDPDQSTTDEEPTLPASKLALRFFFFVVTNKIKYSYILAWGADFLAASIAKVL